MAEDMHYRIWSPIRMMKDSISEILVSNLTPVAKVGAIKSKMQEYGIIKLLGEGGSELRDMTAESEVGNLHNATTLGEYGLTRKHQIEAMMILGKYPDDEIRRELEHGTSATITRAFNKLQNVFPTFSLEEKSTDDKCNNIVTLTIYGTNDISKYWGMDGLRQYILNAGFELSPIIKGHSIQCFTKCLEPVGQVEQDRRKESRAIGPMGWACSLGHINKLSETNCQGEDCVKPMCPCGNKKNKHTKDCQMKKCTEHKPPKPAFKHTKSIQKTKRSRKQSSKKRKSVKKNKSLKKIKPKEKMKI